MTRRHATALLALVAGAAALTACGSKGITLDPGDRDDPRVRHGAQLFAERCAGCHTLDAAGAEGSSVSIADTERVDGPNFNTRRERVPQVLYAIRNGGFSGGVMPQNIVVGRDAEDVALFLSRYAGRQARAPKAPSAKVQPSGGRQREAAGDAEEVQGGREPARNLP
jgi:mono/diheme cytochrome c family protein